MVRKLVSLTFGSYDELLTQSERGECKWTSPKRRSRDIGEHWFGTENFEEAMRLARDGWADGRAKIVHGLETAAVLQREPIRRGRTYDVAGMLPDVPRFIAGAPDCMFTVGEDLRARRPVVRVVFAPCWSAGVAEKNIINRGVALLSIVDQWEDDGYSVEIDLAFRAEADGWDFRVTCPVKRAGEPLELDRLAFVLANPSILRRVIFSLYEQQGQKGFEGAFTGSFGSPADIPLRELDQGSVYIPAVHWGESEWHELPTALASMSKRLAAGWSFKDEEDTP